MHYVIGLNLLLAGGSIQKYLLLVYFYAVLESVLSSISISYLHVPGCLHLASAGSGAHSPFPIHKAVVTPPGISPVSHW